jgi:TPR repeat protein
LEAAKWLRRAADQGDPDAQFELADMYHRGRGVQKDTNVAASWYLRSAQQGLAIAQWTIGRRRGAARLRLGVHVDELSCFASSVRCRS